MFQLWIGDRWEVVGWLSAANAFQAMAAIGGRFGCDFVMILNRLRERECRWNDELKHAEMYFWGIFTTNQMICESGEPDSCMRSVSEFVLCAGLRNSFVLPYPFSNHRNRTGLKPLISKLQSGLLLRCSTKEGCLHWTYCNPELAFWLKNLRCNKRITITNQSGWSKWSMASF